MLLHMHAQISKGRPLREAPHWAPHSNTLWVRHATPTLTAYAETLKLCCDARLLACSFAVPALYKREQLL